MCAQNVLSGIIISLSVVCTIILLFNIKKKIIKTIKNNIIAVFVCSVVLWGMAILVIFLDGEGGIQSFLAIFSAFLMPALMILIVVIYQKLSSITKQIEQYEKSENTVNDCQDKKL